MLKFSYVVVQLVFKKKRVKFPVPLWVLGHHILRYTAQLNVFRRSNDNLHQLQ